MDSNDEAPFQQFPLVDAIDHEILMHRDAHFGGQFSLMLDYYKKEGKGTQPEFNLSRIEYLAALEQELKQNLAALFLAAHEMQRVADSREAYQRLRAIYEVKKEKSPYPKLIADLILTEDEEGEEEISAIASEKEKIVPPLIDLIRSEEFYDPLFPGYGQAPFLAVKALGRIGDKRAIISLFEALGHGDFFADEQVVKALKAIGKPAQDFLLHVIRGRPINEDNEKAAIALVAFKDEDEVAEHCLELLQQSDIQKDPCLPTYLVLICAGLKSKEKREIFKKLAERSEYSSLVNDMTSIMHDWKEEKQAKE